jgi:hypothetical protein
MIAEIGPISHRGRGKYRANAGALKCLVLKIDNLAYSELQRHESVTKRFDQTPYVSVGGERL